MDAAKEKLHFLATFKDGEGRSRSQKDFEGYKEY